MSLFIPGQHWLVEAKVLDFDPVSQTGHVQFIGMYGIKARSDYDSGRIDPQPVGSDPNYLSRAQAALQAAYEPQAVYQPGDWVAVLGVPKGPTGVEYTNDIFMGVTYREFKTAYWIIGKRTWLPDPANLDHTVGAKLNNAPLSFPPITYQPLPQETQDQSGEDQFN